VDHIAKRLNIIATKLQKIDPKLAIVVDKASQKLEGKIVCQKCGQPFNYGSQAEIAMGAIKCPYCHTILTQTGEIPKNYDTLFIKNPYIDRDNMSM
jgi:DNA-directed RNA polymerase subunit RPC12/RpoP